MQIEYKLLACKFISFNKISPEEENESLIESLGIYKISVLIIILSKIK